MINPVCGFGSGKTNLIPHSTFHIPQKAFHIPQKSAFSPHQWIWGLRRTSRLMPIRRCWRSCWPIVWLRLLLNGLLGLCGAGVTRLARRLLGSRPPRLLLRCGVCGVHGPPRLRLGCDGVPVGSILPQGGGWPVRGVADAGTGGTLPVPWHAFLAHGVRWGARRSQLAVEGCTLLTPRGAWGVAVARLGCSNRAYTGLRCTLSAL